MRIENKGNADGYGCTYRHFCFCMLLGGNG